MTDHLPILPFLIPFAASALLMLLSGRLAVGGERAISFAALSLGALSALALMASARQGDVTVYAIGDWPAPFGIALVVDRLSALMVALVYALAVPALLTATAGEDRRGLHFHALFHLLVAGLVGAFLTGDLFNLFVCFEILLIASYALLVHGGGHGRVRAGLPYVLLNLVGSTLFLVAIAILYGTLGTLAIADIAGRLPLVPQADMALVRAGLTILALVFLLKAALLPMAFWLPHVYSAAAAPVGALFAVMTKVGIVALLRLTVLGVGDAPAGAGMLQPWLPVLALATIVLGTVGAFAARRLGVIAANAVLISSGTLLFALSALDPRATSALLFYLPHTTLVTGGLFLLAGAISVRRGDSNDWLVRGPVIANRGALGLAFLILAVAVSGLPPLSGFFGKLFLLQGIEGGWRALWWTTLLISGLGVALVLARVGSILFWEPEGHAETPVARERIGPARTAGLALLVLASPLFVVAAEPVAAYAEATSAQLHARTPYLETVVPRDRPIRRDSRPTPAGGAEP